MELYREKVRDFTRRVLGGSSIRSELHVLHIQIGIYYLQIFGTKMNSPFSPVIADITLKNMEKTIIEAFPINLPFYYRYVVLADSSSIFNIVLNTFNSFHSRLQFAMEKTNKRLNFLDVTMILKNNFIRFNWIHKPTYSEGYFHFESRHPLCQKRHNYKGLIGNFPILLPEIPQKNLKFVVNVDK